jgi:hypothetical protein
MATLILIWICAGFIASIITFSIGFYIEGDDLTIKALTILVLFVLFGPFSLVLIFYLLIKEFSLKYGDTVLIKRKK